MENRKLLILTTILAALAMRILPHPPNIAPIGGLALFSGSYIAGPLAFLLPLVVMFVSDIFLGFHSAMFFVYLSFALIVFLGRILKKKKRGYLVLAALISSVSFFLITNFGVWLTGTMYSRDMSGLIECYIMGLPFFRNTIIGDMFYSFTLFYGFDLIRKQIGRSFAQRA